LKTGNGQPFVSSNLTASAKAFVVTDVPQNRKTSAKAGQASR